ncbi:MAG TPA: hypothetical protein PLS71_23355, partial [Leptospiraceae bacterium]|nr:hypothetical protein [Leptospiraceae bacterium]
KVILEYKFENEDLFKTLVIDFLKEEKLFNQDHIHEKIAKVEIQENKAIANESHSIENRKLGSISTMKYSIFLEELSRLICINKKTLHEAILESGKDLSPYLNQKTLREIKQNFDHFLMANAFDKFSIEYKKISNSVHPTKFTDAKGNILTEISPSDVGRQYSREEVAEAYLFDVLYHDSDLEKVNIKEKIREVIVFTKIPKNSIKIPVAGGKSYSPDFAYVLKLGNGKQKLHFIIETKDVRGDEGLREEEKYKIKHAEKFFGDNVKIQFRTQFQNDKIVDLIQEITFSM